MTAADIAQLLLQAKEAIQALPEEESMSVALRQHGGFDRQGVDYSLVEWAINVEQS